MLGLSTKSIKRISEMIGAQFDGLSMSLLGMKPTLTKDKKIVFSTSKNSILSLFFKSLNSKKPNKMEETTVKAILSIANGYIDALKYRTISRVVNDVDSYVRGQRLKGGDISGGKVKEIVTDNMGKAKNHFKLIANSESNKAINMGTALQITKMAEEKKEKDPTVFFIVTVDDVTGSEEFVLHLLKDRKTPRTWKLSEIKSEYHKKGDPEPSFSGLHPNCRCKITYLAEGWGFDKNGLVKFIGLDHDEFKAQRKEHGLPR